MLRVLALLPVVFVPVASAAAQSLQELLARGDHYHDALRPDSALLAYRAALHVDSTSYEAMWKFARAEINVAKQLTDDQSKRRDSLYGVAAFYAQGAVLADSNDAEGHFQLAQAIGRLSRSKSGKARVQFAKQIYNEAARALALDPHHDGAHHVLGAWHAEVERLSGISKFFAKTFLGGGFLEKASWDSAAIHLEQAVALRPSHIYHRLELAEVYADMNRVPDAIAQLEQIAALPPTSDVMDPEYKREAAALLKKLTSGL